MILKKLCIKNIRSFEDEEIVFPKGSTLLSGESGSGKTTILLAIEFALFGLQPSQKGSSLLRSDKEEGTVILECEIDGADIVIERILKKNKKSINQEYASITINNEKFEESVSEIKTKVLKLLNYPRELSKKTNLLYKFTVYTPQEEMKQIILETGDTRLNTLRHVFGIDKYKRIEENASILTAKLREKIRINEIITANFENEKEVIEKKKRYLLELKEKKVSIEQIYLEKTQIKMQKEKALKEIEEKINEKKTLETEKAKTDILIIEKERQLRALSENAKSLENEINESKKFSFSDEEYSSINQRIKFQEEKNNELQKEYVELMGRITLEESRYKEALFLKNKIVGLNNCPTCLQKVTDEYKINITINAEKEIERGTIKISELLQKKREYIEKIEELKKMLENFRLKKTEMELLKIKRENVREKEERIKEVEKQKKALEQDDIMLKKHAVNLQSTIKEFDYFVELYKERELEVRKTAQEENNALILRAENNKEIQFLESDIRERSSFIERKEKIKKETEKIKELEYWISEKFIQIMLYTEKQVMTTLKEEFSKLFSKWFSIIVPDNLSVRLDDDFSPVIEQQDYSIDYSFLSGGERTAIALAYRLALNQVINSVLSNIKSANLVILDEPTDGFSNQQLDKIRDVLDQLTVDQMIIVSHEPKIESFVDNIIKIKKEKGISIVEQ